MAFDYAALRAEVDPILAEFGQACELRRGSGSPVVDPVSGTVTPGAPQVFQVVGVVVDYNDKLVDYNDKLVDGETIKRGDRLVYVQAVERPRVGDTFVEANGTQWTVVDFDAVDPAGVAVLFSLQVRR